MYRNSTIEFHVFFPQTPYGKGIQKKQQTNKQNKTKNQDDKVKQKSRGQLFPSRCPPGYPKQNHQIVKD